MGTAITLAAVSKHYRRQQGTVLALNEVSLTVPEGLVIGCVGPNGAGKTTLFKLLAGLIFPTAGRVTVLGEEPSNPAARSRLGYCTEIPLLNENLTVCEYLTYCGRLSGMGAPALRQRLSELLTALDAEDLRTKVIRTMSKGQKQRINLAQSLLSDPDLLLLDEPFSGLDPTMQRGVRALIADLRQRGKTVLINSHQLTQVEQVCDQVVLIAHGRVGNWIDLVQEREAWVLAVFTPPPEGRWPLPEGALTQDAGRYEYRIRRAEFGAWLTSLIAAGGTLHSAQEGGLHLEDVYTEAVALKEVAR
ncbi:MAG TPA: ABC transporter ATP-binding protein [Symbiobacteriaceae bacterium]|nr:ABC transporter ATP-binding protein [Symbiobacteriaceae bacterium]